jgi:pimeloyl-ACP methyl ester carboxylesterase
MCKKVTNPTRSFCAAIGAGCALLFGASPASSASLEAMMQLAASGIQEGPAGRDFWFDLPAIAAPDAKRGDIHWMRAREDAPKGSIGWTMIYVSEGPKGDLVYVSGELYLPRSAAHGTRRIALWNHPTAGMSDACAPSWSGSAAKVSRFGFERVPGIEALLAQGYVVVMSDYQGLGTPGLAAYMDGELAAKASLDAVRAAQRFTPASAGSAFVSYGHSQGGQTTLWVAALVSQYAPELELRGSIAIAPAVDTYALTLWDISHPPLGAYVVTTAAGLVVRRSELRLRDLLTEAGLELLTTMTDMCFATRAAAEHVQEPLVRLEALRAGAPWNEALRQNSNIYGQPLTGQVLIIQGQEDFDVPASITRDVVARLNKSGSKVSYKEGPGLDHFDVIPWAVSIATEWFPERW